MMAFFDLIISRMKKASMINFWIEKTSDTVEMHIMNGHVRGMEYMTFHFCNRTFSKMTY